jgi:hypothetical protein
MRIEKPLLHDGLILPQQHIQKLAPARVLAARSCRISHPASVPHVSLELRAVLCS